MKKMCKKRNNNAYRLANLIDLFSSKKFSLFDFFIFLTPSLSSACPMQTIFQAYDTIEVRYTHKLFTQRHFSYLVSGNAELIFWKYEVGALRSSLPGTDARLRRSCSTFRIDRRGWMTT